MQTKCSILRQCAAIATAMLLVVGSRSAVADQPPVQLLGVYQVLPGKTNSADHETAEFAVFRSHREPREQFGLFFLQRKGDYKGDAFACTEANDSAGDGSLSCSKPASRKGKAFREVVRIGPIGSAYCDALADEKNGGGKEFIVSECPQDGAGNGNARNGNRRCACYNIEHLCFNEATGEYDEPCGGGGNGAEAPPGSGAGSGGSH